MVNGLALWQTNKEVQQQFLKDTGKTVSVTTINYYRDAKAWKTYKQKTREAFEALIAEESFSSKRIRIQTLSKLFWRMQKNEKSLMSAAHVLSQIREEIEGQTSSGIQINQYNQYNSMTDAELREIIAENSRFLASVDSRKEKIQIQGPASGIVEVDPDYAATREAAEI